MPKVAIIGIGLIGGSLGQALRRTAKYRVLGISRRKRTLREATTRQSVPFLRSRSPATLGFIKSVMALPMIVPFMFQIPRSYTK